MSQLKFNCDQCSATIRYGEQHVGRRVKCPKCQHALTVPKSPSDPFEDQVVLGGEDDAPPPKLAEPATSVCRSCGKKVKAGVTRCKRCREEVSAELASRMKREASFDKAMASQAEYLAKKPNRGGISTPLLIVLVVVTFGTWLPFSYWWFRDDDD